MVVLYLDKNGAAIAFKPEVQKIVDAMGLDEIVAANDVPVSTGIPKLIFTEFEGLDYIQKYLQQANRTSKFVPIRLEDSKNGFKDAQFTLDVEKKIPTILYTRETHAREFLDANYARLQLLGNYIFIPAVIKKMESIDHRVPVLLEKLNTFDRTSNQFDVNNWEEQKPGFFGVSYHKQRAEYNEKNSGGSGGNLREIMGGGGKFWSGGDK